MFICIILSKNTMKPISSMITSIVDNIGENFSSNELGSIYWDC